MANIYYTMITSKHTPPWSTNYTNRFIRTYNEFLKNLKCSIDHAYPNQQVLVIDNTYLNYLQVLQIIDDYECDVVVILSILDPPYTWHYLAEQLESKYPNKIFRYVGNESPDVEITFWFLLCNREFSQYREVDILPTTFEYIFLNYNFKPHDHRVKFIQRMQEQNLLNLGYWTLDQQQHQSMPKAQGLEQNLGDLDIWQRHFLNITSKTLFRMNTEPLLLGEKLFKPIIGLRPFVMNGSPRYYDVVRKLGFDCFEDIWPVANLATELHDLESTMNRSHQTICDIVQDLKQENLPALYVKLLPRLKYNRDLWYNLAAGLDKKYTQELIVF